MLLIAQCLILFAGSQKSMCIDLCLGKQELILVILSVTACTYSGLCCIFGWQYIQIKHTCTVFFNTYCPYLLAGGTPRCRQCDDTARVVCSKDFDFFHSADDLKQTMAWTTFSVGDNNYIICISTS